jgi:hypothetical protein
MFISLGLLDPNADSLYTTHDDPLANNNNNNEKTKTEANANVYSYCDGATDDRLAHLRTVMKTFLKSSTGALTSSNRTIPTSAEGSSTLHTSQEDTDVIKGLIASVESATVNLRSASEAQQTDISLNLLTEGYPHPYSIQHKYTFKGLNIFH